MRVKGYRLYYSQTGNMEMTETVTHPSAQPSENNINAEANNVSPTEIVRRLVEKVK